MTAARTLVLMCGLPASGKTTTAARLHALGGGALIRQCDAYRRLGISLPEWVRLTRGFTVGVGAYDAVRNRAYDEMARRVAERLDAGDDPVIVDAVHAERAKRRRLYALAAAAGARPVLVWCSCEAPDEIARRLAARRGRESEPEREASDASVWRDIARRWQDPAADGVPVIRCDTLTGAVTGTAEPPWLSLVRDALATVVGVA